MACLREAVPRLADETGGTEHSERRDVHMRKQLTIVVLLAALALGGVAVAAHVATVDPAAVPVGFLTAHNRVAEVPISAFARAAAADGAEVTVQHIRLVPNQPIPWHTHPGPVFVLIERGAFTYEHAKGGNCVATTYTAGQGFVDRGFGKVHQATAGPDGAEIYAVYALPPGSQNHLIPTAPAPACIP
jgi:quercetin dioxygenase-like cupin family protein